MLIRRMLPALVAAITACTPAPKSTPSGMEIGVYVWQRQWSGAVLDGLEHAAPEIDALYVLAAEYDAGGDLLSPHLPNVDWTGLASAGKPVIPVIRAHQWPGIDDEKSRDAIVADVAGCARAIADRARDAGVAIAGLQIDYDCATSKLPAYAALLRAIKKQLSDTALSITALPTWIDQPGFDAVLDSLDAFVLQVHAFETPATIEDDATLCDPDRVPGWVAGAAAYGKPFHVSLPTYGYRLLYDANSGAFRGLRGEGRAEVVPGSVERVLMADPVAMADLARELRIAPARHLMGIVWFRLPVEGDALNWSWPVLHGVMDGAPPAPSLRADVRTPEPGLHEIWVVNDGFRRVTEPIQVRVDWILGGRMARDTANGYTAVSTDADGATIVNGPAPLPGDDVMAAWFRFEDPERTIHVELVEVTP